MPERVVVTSQAVARPEVQKPPCATLAAAGACQVVPHEVATHHRPGIGVLAVWAAGLYLDHRGARSEHEIFLHCVEISSRGSTPHLYGICKDGVDPFLGAIQCAQPVAHAVVVPVRDKHQVL